MSSRWSMLALCAVGLASSSVAGMPPTSADSGSLLRSSVDADALTLAGLSARIGDDAVLAALAQHDDVLLCLAALRSTPYLRSPASALPALAELAAGRDPELAPAAARRALAISQALALRHANTDELMDGAIAPIRSALAALAQAQDARRDVRVSAGQAAALLQTLP
jgi:hypothetical protein